MQLDLRSRFKGGTMNGSDYAATARARLHAAGSAGCLPGLPGSALVSRASTNTGVYHVDDTGERAPRATPITQLS